MFSCYAYCKGFWFRCFGYGMAIDIDAPMLFSERMGIRKALRIGRVRIQALTPN